MKKLIGLRAENGVSQDKMAEIIGTSKNAYYQKEIGKREFKLSEIKKIEKYFKLNQLVLYNIFFREE